MDKTAETQEFQLLRFSKKFVILRLIILDYKKSYSNIIPYISNNANSYSLISDVVRQMRIALENWRTKWITLLVKELRKEDRN